VTDIKVPKVIALVDWLHLLTVQVKVAANDKDMSDHNRAGRRALAQLNAVKSSVGTDGHVIVCMDSPPYWRKQRFAEYKGTRSEREPEFASILDWTLDAIVEDGFHIARAPGEEADDVMATLARVYAELGCRDVRLVGADKDGLQCVSDRVRLFVPKERGEFDIRGPEWLLKAYGVKPSDFALLLAIMGDKSDNIGGIDGIGPAHGAKLINAYKTIDGMAQGLVAAQTAALEPGAKPLAAVWKYYAAGMAKLPLWWELTTLRTNVALEFDPMAYLVPNPLALPDDDIEQDAIAGELDDGEEFNPPTLDELEEERRVMAASLPVGPPLSTEKHSPPPVGEPVRDPTERRAAMAAEADKVLPLPKAGGAGSVGSTVPAPLASPAASTRVRENPYTPELSNARSMVIGKDPKADAVLRALAPEARAAVEQLGRDLAAEGAARSSGSTSAATAPAASAPSTPAAETSPGIPPAPSAGGAASTPSAATPPAAAPSSSAQAQVVPQSRGPRKPRISDGLDQNELAVRVEPRSWELAAQPGTAKELLQIAEIVFQSPLFRSFGTPHGTFAIMAYGRELGMGYMQSLLAFYEVNNRPFMGAHALRGLILAHPDCEFFVNTECTAEASTWITRRKSWPKDVPTASYRFTYAEAIEIGLTTGKNAHNWTKNRRSMVDKTASSRLGRQVWADVIGGLHCPEEAHE